MIIIGAYGFIYGNINSLSASLALPAARLPPLLFSHTSPSPAPPRLSLARARSLWH